ncbi:MAG: multifunctional CCA addition/repair protein [Gammaproteobacteria bacterium]|nr:multifunctional CCA addition/repair protein [Gammaproteobacteria bacterium]
MNIYRVGGCVRDRLLGLPIVDIDWVVTGATADSMLALGYKSIGKDFPVFLHPETKQAYALARSERKTGPGYCGFEFNTDPNISIEQDLLRRDLTINAIAENEQGELIDPYGGQQDLEARILRHVSSAFNEDPVRVLRVARFAARYHHLGFSLAPETADLIRQIGASGELGSLVAERVWSEMSRALNEPNPEVFFQTLRDCDVLGVLFPDIDALFGVPQTAKYHPEVDTGVHVMMALQKSAELKFDNETRFAVLMHDLGKATTAKHLLPSHQGHEQQGIKLVKAFCARWRVPKAHTELALITTEYHLYVHRALELKPATLLKLFTSTDVFRKPQRFIRMTQACLADLRGRLNFENAAYPQADFLVDLGSKLRQADLSSIKQGGLQGSELGEAIREFRLAMIKQYKQALQTGQ